MRGSSWSYGCTIASVTWPLPRCRLGVGDAAMLEAVQAEALPGRASISACRSDSFALGPATTFSAGDRTYQRPLPVASQ